MTTKRIPELDVFRGIAVLLVMGYHPAAHYTLAGRSRPLAYICQVSGWMGVDLFFVLSGFLIGGLLFDELERNKTLDVRRFIIRRIFKIWPAYFVLVTFFFLWYFIKGYPFYNWPVTLAMLPNLAHLQNYVPTLAVHTWSLAVEEHFYLVLPLALMWIHKPMTRRAALSIAAISFALIFLLLILVKKSVISAVATGIIQTDLLGYYKSYTHTGFMWIFGLQLFAYALWFLASRLWRISLPVWIIGMLAMCLSFRMTVAATYMRFEADPSWPAYSTHLRLDSLLFGVLLAYGLRFAPNALIAIQRRRLLILCVCIFALILVVFWPFGGWFTGLIVDRTVIYLASGGILIAALPSPGHTSAALSLPAKVVAWIGFYSYSIYLWHVNPARYALIDWLRAYTQSWVILTCVYIMVSLILGVVLGKLVEWPMLRLRDRLFPAQVFSPNVGSTTRTLPRPGAERMEETAS